MDTSKHKYIICKRNVYKDGIMKLEVGKKYYTFNFDNIMSNTPYFVFDVEFDKCLGYFYKEYFIDICEWRNNRIDVILK